MQMLSVDRLVGQTLGNYRVERLLGQGRLSAVYFAQNTLTNINGALTLFIVPEHFSQDARARFMQRFRTEATALTGLQNAHILPVHEYGEYQGYPYLVTPYMTNGSLADIIKRQGRYLYTDVQDVLEQVVEGLEYAHRKGVIHGTLKPSNIVLSDDEEMLVAGFGLMHMLQMRGVEPDGRSYGHLLSIADTFLAAPEYIAPEIVQGQSIDKRSDIYALGIMLFELLSGKPPFTGQKPLDVAKMHVQQSIPSLRTIYPDIPMAVVSVVNQALDRDPTRRFQSASELAEAFAQAVVGASGGTRSLESAGGRTTLPDTPARGYATSNWQLMPPIVTGKMAALNSSPNKRAEQALENANTWQSQETPDMPTRFDAPMRANTTTARGPQQPLRQAPSVQPRVVAPPTLVPGEPEPYTLPEPPAEMMANYVSQRQAPSDGFINRAPIVQSVQPMQQAPLVQPIQAAPLVQAAPPVQQVPPASRPEEKKQEWWEQAQDPMMGSMEANQWGEAPAWMQPASSGKRSRSAGRGRNNAGNKRNNPMGRRKVIALLAGGGVAAAGLLVGVKLHSGTTMANTTATNQATGNTTTGRTTANQTTTKQAVAKTTGNTTAKTTTNTAPKAPAAATHTGKVIGSTAMAPNSAVVFNNNQDLLIRLPNGNFVAYSRSCTHQGVLINYDPASKNMVCPAHGAIFDPAQGAKVLQGPAPTPVASVKVTVNSDGTVTSMV